MINLIILMGVLNMLGGRELLGDGVSGQRLIFRAVLPSIMVALCYFILSSSMATALYILVALIAGSCLWAAPGWSFDEINGNFDRAKYPAFIRWLGLRVFPAGSYYEAALNRRRGVLMKGMRGLYDYPTFALLSAINPYALIFGLFTALMGGVYWAVGRIIKGEQYDVLTAEFIYGCFRWSLIIFTIFTTIKGDLPCVF